MSEEQNQEVQETEWEKAERLKAEEGIRRAARIQFEEQERLLAERKHRNLGQMSSAEFAEYCRKILG